MKKMSLKNAFFIVSFLVIITSILSFFAGRYYNDYKHFKTSINYVKTSTNIDGDKVVELPEEDYNAIENEYGDSIKESLSINIGSVLPSPNDYFVNVPNNVDSFVVSYYQNGAEISVDKIANYDGSNYIANRIGSYDIFVGGFVSKLFILDNEKPVVKFKDVTIYQNQAYSISDFIDEYRDNSNNNDYIYILQNDSDLKKKDIGVYYISIMICDSSMNCVDGTVKLTILKKNSSSSNQNSSGSSNNSGGNSNSTGGTSGNSNSGSGSSNGNSSNTGNSNNSNEGNSSGTVTGNTSPGEDIGSGNSDNSNDVTGEVVYVKDIEEKEITSITDIKYGVKNIEYSYVLYELYSDGSKIEKYRSDPFYTIDQSGFNASIAEMKPEGIELYNLSSSTRDTFLAMTNQYRAEAGVSPLVIDETLSIIASTRAVEIAYSKLFSHTRPNGSSWETMITDSSFNFYTSFAGENLAGNFKTDHDAIVALKESTSHYSNMINARFTKMGVGVCTFNGSTYWVQLFAA